MNETGRSIGILCLLFITAAFFACGDDSSTGPAEQEEALIAFSSSSTGNYEIFTMKIDGSELTNITNKPNSIEKEAAWSPDGDYLAYTSNATGVDNIFIYDVANGTHSQVTANGGKRATWSADGSKLMFGKGSDIWVINADGTNEQAVITDGAGPAWSHDGTKVAFERSNNIYLMNADGSNVTQLTNTSGSQPAWSPDDSKITFSSNRDQNPEIYSMNADGSNQQRLTVSNISDLYPTYTPGGSQIVYTRNYKIAVIPATGGTASDILDQNGSDPDCTAVQ